jgi:hypothetical protein
VGFFLGLLAGVLLFRGGNREAAVEARTPTSGHLEEAQRQLAALEKQISAEREEGF